MIGVVGAGAFGTALAIAWGKDRPVRLWGRDSEAMEQAGTTRRLPRLADVALPDGVLPTPTLSDLTGCDTLVLAVPMQSLRGLLPDIAALSPDRAVAACKGIDLRRLDGPVRLLEQELPQAAAAILSGPSFASDIARGLPTALSLGCRDDDVGAVVQEQLSCATLRLYRTTDTTGVELGGALKNVIAIACGAVIGAGLGDSARAALMTRGMAEMLRLANALGAERDTLMGLSGLGDLSLTCSTPTSRNFALGQALGRGQAAPNATTEGVATAQAALSLADRHGIALPITRVTAALVAGDMTVKDALETLMTRTLTTETDP